MRAITWVTKKSRLSAAQDAKNDSELSQRYLYLSLFKSVIFSRFQSHDVTDISFKLFKEVVKQNIYVK